MEIGQIRCDNLGMTQDTDVSKLGQKQDGTNNYAFENHNIRILAVNDNTKFAVTNEKSTLKLGELSGTFIGGCKLGNYLVVFIKSASADSIYRIYYAGGSVVTDLLYSGDLGFSSDNAIEAIGYYESEEVQKVYWVDGVNPNRFINIADVEVNGTKVAPDYSSKKNTYFDFQGAIEKIPSVKITKNFEKTGYFLAGTLQYFISYYNKYGVETCLVWNSDLQYIATATRGAKADESVGCSFDIEIDDVDTSYEYLRIYSCYRSGINSGTSARIVADIYIGGNSTIKYTDTGTVGETFDVNDIPYIGGQNIIATTLDYKQDTLFLGDVKVSSVDINYNPEKKDVTIVDLGTSIKENANDAVQWVYKFVSKVADSGVYSYDQEIENSQKSIAGFKWREVYRFGIQFMDEKGEWTSAFWLGDKYCDLKPLEIHDTDLETDVNGNILTDTFKHNFYEKKELINNIETVVSKYPCIYTQNGVYIAQAWVDVSKIDIPDEYIGKAYRLLVAETNQTNRRIIEQGVINPTMFNFTDRCYNRPYSIPSWIFRPRKSSIVNRHFDTLPIQTARNAELQGITKRQVPAVEQQGDSFYNAFMLIFAPNYLAGCRIKWKLIYYNTGNTDEEKVANLNKFYNYKGDGTDEQNCPVAVYGSNYKVVSSGTVTATKWSTCTSEFHSRLITDLNTSGEKVVISSAMLPNGSLMKDAWRNSQTDTKIWAVIGAALATVAAAVATVFTCGAAAGLSAVATMAVSAAASMCASAAVAGASATAALATKIKDMDSIDRALAQKSIFSLLEEHTVYEKGKGPWRVMHHLEKFFEGTYNSSNWFCLNGDTEDPFTKSLSTHELGSDYNVYCMSGPLTQLTPEDEEKKRKESLFCVDESIVTLNSPTVEDNTYSVDNSEGLKLDLVGLIPVEAVHGEYQLQTSQGLNNSAQVIPHRDVNNGVSSIDIQGILNGDFYQDTYIEPSAIAAAIDPDKGVIKPMQVTAATETYRQFMWGRESSASLWMPGIPLIKATAVSVEGEFTSDDYVNEAPAQVLHKIFANARYSTNTLFQEPYTLSIESPIVCLDDESSLKCFHYNNDSMYYYKNVDSIVPFYEDYDLIVGGQKYPGEVAIEEDKDPINLTDMADCQDPVHIKYRQTPHILIPIKRNVGGVATILPYIQDEDIVTPKDLYEDIDGIRFDGVNNIVVSNAASYKVIRDVNTDYTALDGTVISKGEICKILTKVNSSFNSAFNSALENFTTPDGVYGHTNLDEIFFNTIWTSDVLLIVARDGYFQIYNYNRQYKVSKITTVPLGACLKEVSLSKDVNYIYSALNNKGTFMIKLSRTDSSSPIITPSISGNLPDINKAIISWGNVYYSYDESGSSIITIPDELSDIEISKQVNNTWNQTQLPWNLGNQPYLFLGELVKKVFDYESWNGGYTQNALEQLTWIPASEVTPIDKSILNTWGDTFYQRWDCEKTYPYTENDKNSVVDVLSFMLESHVNLDGRCDVNRGTGNLLNLRPTNTLINKTYSQTDNFFSYKTLDEKFSKSHFEADVIWSLSKNNMDDIDKWTSLTALNEMSLDGRYGTIRKILNVNDVLIAFQDSAISALEYNQKTAISTEAGVPLQLGNTGKVTGYQVVSSTSGCRNKWSINKNSASVFFVDDLNKSFNAFSTKNGAQDLGVAAEFSQWFKRNITGGIWSPSNRRAFRTSYDELTHDLYIINDNTCLIYNTLLGRFTSFMDYIDTPMIVNLASPGGDSRSFAIRDTYNKAFMDIVEVYQMFAGPTYGYIYGQFAPYSIEYRVCPDQLHDSIFTNYVYEADWIDPTSDVDGRDVFGYAGLSRRMHSFDTVDAWNEYQKGSCVIANTPLFTPYTQKTKFRVWRGNIPREEEGYIPLPMNRMRNPWIHLKFTKHLSDDSKMIFHNLAVTYYNQYGRY